MIRWQRGVACAVLAAGTVLPAAWGDGPDVDPEEAAALAAATTGPLTYTTTYAAALIPPLGGIQGTIEGDQRDPTHAFFRVSVVVTDADVPVATPPRSFTLDHNGAAVLGRLAVVPTDVLALVGTGDGLKADGEGRGYRQDPVARFRERLNPGAVQASLAAFLTETVSWLVGPLTADSAAEVGASVMVTGASAELLVASDGSAVNSLVLRVDYDLDAGRFMAALGQYLPSAEPSNPAPSGIVPGAANFRVVITGEG